MPTLFNRLKHGWNAFRGREPTNTGYSYGGYYTSYRPERTRLTRGHERSIITSVFNRIAIDVANIKIKHCQTNEDGVFESVIKSGLNYCLSEEANIDQTGRELIQDVVLSLCDEGCVAIVPVETTLNPKITGSYDIQSMRVGKVTKWFPQHVQVQLYNEFTGKKEDIVLPKSIVTIIENPLYSVMNEPNSTLQRLIRKLNILDAVDEQAGSGKLDIIIQLPYVANSKIKREQAETRRRSIEEQLSGSKYGVAYADGTERITQLNRPAENNLLKTIEYLTSMLYSQLGITEEVFNGTADEKTMLNYYNRTIEPIISAIVENMNRKFLTKNARSRGQRIMYFRQPFSLVSAKELADVANVYISAEILTSNELRAVLGYKPVDDERANTLMNKNINTVSDFNEKGSAEEPKEVIQNGEEEV